MIKVKNVFKRHCFRGAPTLSRPKRRLWTISASACARRPPVKAGLLAKRWKKSAGESPTMTDLVMTIAGAVLLRPEHPFQALVDMIADTLSPSSRRVYRHTYDSWRAFADRYQIVYLDLSFTHILAFLQDTDVAHDTRLSWKAHMLRLLDWLEESNERGPWYGQQRRQVLKFIKFRRQDSDGGGSRSKRALSKSEADALMDVWAHDTRPVAVRNTAMLRLMVYTGLRRAELVALRAAQGGSYACVFFSMTTGRDPEFASDKPMSASGSARMLKIAVERSGVEHISAHDLRRTHITLALDNGAPLQDMQAQAGHANASTTLRYPQAADAKARRERIAFQFTPALDATRAWSELSPLDDAAQSSSGITPHLRQ